MSVSKSVLLGDFPCAKNWGKQTNLKQSNTFSTVVVFIVMLLQRIFNKGYWPKLKIIFNSTEFLKWYPWWWVWSPCSGCAHCSEFPGHLAPCHPLLSLALCWHPSHLAPVLLGLFFPRSGILYAEIPLWQRLARCSLTQFPLPPTRDNYIPCLPLWVDWGLRIRYGQWSVVRRDEHYFQVWQ